MFLAQFREKVKIYILFSVMTEAKI